MMNRLCQFQLSALCVRGAGVVRAGRVFCVYWLYYQCCRDVNGDLQPGPPVQRRPERICGGVKRQASGFRRRRGEETEMRVFDSPTVEAFLEAPVLHVIEDEEPETFHPSPAISKRESHQSAEAEIESAHREGRGKEERVGGRKGTGLAWWASAKPRSLTTWRWLRRASSCSSR
jgi:hypothetical protein|uniref:Uncharacterized protein n=1 Tax=Zea mays TaxID=4577 RepID=A0A804UCQ4_MAIZE